MGVLTYGPRACIWEGFGGPEPSVAFVWSFFCSLWWGSDFVIIDFVGFNRKINSLVLSKCSSVVPILSNAGVIEKEMTVY